MRNYHKLLELANNDVKLSFSNRYNSGDKKWNIEANKNVGGVLFSIDKYFDDLEEGIDEIHLMWKSLTKTMPEHRLNILEHRPFNPNDPAGEAWKSGDKIDDPFDNEIPF